MAMITRRYPGDSEAEAVATIAVWVIAIAIMNWRFNR